MQTWRIFPNEPLATLPGLKPGVTIHRNRDHAWEQALARPSAQRRIALSAVLRETDSGFALELTDEDGVRAAADAPFARQPAREPAQAEAALKTQLDRFGNTDFRVADISVQWTQPWFVPASLVNRLRREAVAALEAARLAAHVRLPRRPAEPPR